MTIILIISVFITAIYAGLIVYYSFAWRSVKTFKPESTSARQVQGNILSTHQPINQLTENTVNSYLSTVISILIPARNEEKNIRSCIGSILQQSYPAELYELIIVDDHSEDNTASIIRSYREKNIKLISLKDHVTDSLNSYKKKAIEIAAEQAKGKLIVTTDADCIAPANWLQTIAAFYERYQPAFIAMPVAVNGSSRFIEIFQSLDFMTLQGITAAVVSKKQMTMCNGANMAYERKVFYEVNGFAGIDKIASGDDMLLMNKIYRQCPDRVMFLKSPDVIIHTEPVHTIKQFFHQRIRWASKADKYDDKRILPVLILVYIFNCLLLVLPMLSLFEHSKYSIFNIQYSIFQYWIFLLVCKTVIELIFLFPVATFFGKTKLLILFPLMQPFHILYTIIAGWLGKFGSYQWKGRKVN